MNTSYIIDDKKLELFKNLKITLDDNNSSKCTKCSLYFGNKDWDNKCYRCFNNFISPTNEDFKKYIESLIPDSKWLDMIRYTCLKKNMKMLASILDQVKTNNKYLTANFVSELLRNVGEDTKEKSRILMPFIIDTWNISKKNNFTGIEECIFNKYWEDKPQSIPFIEKWWFPDRNPYDTRGGYF